MVPDDPNELENDMDLDVDIDPGYDPHTEPAYDEFDDDMDGDAQSALASVGWGDNEDYGDFGMFDPGDY